MVKVVKMCDMNQSIAAKVFEMLNGGKVHVTEGYDSTIVTDVEPKELVYPEGWYYAKGNFRNKYTSTTGAYGEIPMVKSNGDFWEENATYCTLN